MNRREQNLQFFTPSRSICWIMSPLSDRFFTVFPSKSFHRRCRCKFLSFLSLIFGCVCGYFPGSIFPSCKPSDTIFKITFWLGYLNSCINPVIYPCFSREFKKAFTSVLHAQCRRTASPAAKSQGHPRSSNADLKPSTSDLSSDKTAFCWCCRRSISSPPGGGLDPSRVASRSLLKEWCFSASQTPVPPKPPGRRSTKVLCLSLGVSGEAVWWRGFRASVCLESTNAWRWKHPACPMNGRSRRIKCHLLSAALVRTES